MRSLLGERRMDGKLGGMHERQESDSGESQDNIRGSTSHVIKSFLRAQFNTAAFPGMGGGSIETITWSKIDSQASGQKNWQP